MSSYYLQCSLELQDCTKLYPLGSGYLPFTNQSCVRDTRLPGKVGRCGFPGAACVLDEVSRLDNCAFGGKPNNPLCVQGTCRGEVGAFCFTQFDCNAGVKCNSTVATQGGICGGEGAQVNSLNQVDFAQDYCLSGKATPPNSDGDAFCGGGPAMLLPNTSSSSTTSPTHTKVSPGVIAGATIAGVAFVGLALLGLMWIHRRRKSQGNVAANGRKGASGFRTPEMLDAESMDEKASYTAS